MWAGCLGLRAFMKLLSVEHRLKTMDAKAGGDHVLKALRPKACKLDMANSRELPEINLKNFC